MSEQHVHASAKAVSVLLKSWTGIIYLCMNNQQSIKSIVESLRLTSDTARDIMLDMFFQVFRIKPPKLDGNAQVGRRASLKGPTVMTESGNSEPPPARVAVDRLNLLDHHLVILLVTFIENGLLDALVEIIEDDNKQVARKATILIGEILQLCSRLLSQGRAIQIQSLPKLFDLATQFNNEIVRHNATEALAHIDNLHRNTYRAPMNVPSKDGFSSTVDDIRKISARQVENVKIKMGIQIDDTHFRNMLMESQVLITKDYTKWRWDVLMELLQGPLLNPRRLEEALRAKYLRRLIGFLRPLNRRFADIEKTPDNQRYVKLACTLIQTLLANQDGIKFLEQNKFLRQISDCLKQLHPMSGAVETEPLFSRENIEKTLTYGYFTMIGVLSKYKDGVRLLEKFKIFNTFYHLSELKSREDLIKAIITNLDYSLDGHPRILLSKVMTSGYKHVRLYATKHLGTILRNSAKEFNDWGIRLLITQLYDPAMEVCEMAVRVLEETCKDKENLELLVKLRPSLDHLGEVGNPLLLRFLSTSVGFRYLAEFDYVEKEMDEWFQSRNQYYVTQLEVMLTTALRLDGDDNRNDDEDRDTKMHVLMTPPHFYGELAKTEEGCQLLREKGHFREFANFIREHGMEREDPMIITKLKSVLWALGNIGTSKSGLPFLEEEDIVKDIVIIAENSEVLSLKGTCYYVLGLIAKTAQGVEILDELGWESVYDTDTGIGTGLCIPTNLQAFLSFEPWTYYGDVHQSPTINHLIAPSTLIEKNLLKSISQLTNRILSSNASKVLVKIRRQHIEYFSRLDTFLKVIHMLAAYHYRLPTRHLIFELFEIKWTAENLAKLDYLIEQQSENSENNRENGNAHMVNGVGSTSIAESTNASPSHSPTQHSTFHYQHRGSEGMVMSDDQTNIGAEEIIPKQKLSPVMVIKGFMI